MVLRFYNQLGRKIEDFRPQQPPLVRLYACGPTVYDAVHLGNWRTFIFSDLVRRTLHYAGHQVKLVMNITDIDDKIIARAAAEKTAIDTVTDRYTKQFFADRDRLNILPAESYPRATNHLPEMIALISQLLKKGLAYERAGAVYYAVAKFPAYGRLSGLSLENLKAGARVDNDEYSKEAPGDFALWKAAKADEPAWESPWGAGRPGWHLECSAMSMKELGESFDLHLGGVDLIFPHHENEIAQSEGATGRPLAHYWLEGEHLLIGGQKMSKSLGNIYTLDHLEEQLFRPLAYRYLILTAHYRQPLNLTWESLSAAQTALTRLEVLSRDPSPTGKIASKYRERFAAALADDLNLPQALAVAWSMSSDQSLALADKKATLLDFDRVLGLGLAELAPLVIPAKVQALAEAREQARRGGDFSRADELRIKIENSGFIIDDTPQGPRLRSR